MDICFIDIETEVGDCFPHPDTAIEKITLITLHSTKNGTVTFGYRPYAGTEKINYVACNGEIDMLRTFMVHWTGHYPDIVTGWNSEAFDLPYIYNRLVQVLKPEVAKKLSPFGIVTARQIKTKNKDKSEKIVNTYDICGIQHLDYLSLYKKFTFVTRENYKLDTIGHYELKQKKLKNPFPTFRDFYEKDWDTFVLYNIQDTMLVKRLEDKLKLIQIALKICYIAKINFRDCYSPVKTWEAIINNYLLEKNVIPPFATQDVEAEKFAGAYVKEPTHGMKKWITSFDATALYPSLICQYNISPETFIGISENNSIASFVDRKYDLEYLKEKDICIAANGAMFRKDTEGFLPVLCKKMLGDRKKYKGKMLELKMLVGEYSEEEMKQIQNEIAMYSNFEQALKLTLNSLYGGVSNIHFKMFDLRLALAITASGQMALKYGERYINGYMNRLFGTPAEKDWVVYEDTDSIYLDMSEFITRFKPEGTNVDKVKFLDAVCEQKISKVFDRCYTELYEYTNGYEHRLHFKREAISSTSFWTAKKKYAMLVYNSEGVWYDPYYIKVMGLEVVRSSTPECIRESLKKSIELILTSDNDTIIKYIADVRTEFMQRPAHEISFPRGIDNMVKYYMENGVKKGCPVQVRGAINFNRRVKMLGISHIYSDIVDGDKVKYCYMKMPNPMHENILAFPDEFPKEFGLEKYVDYNKQFEKTFLAPLEKILHSVGYVSKRTANLFAHFGR